MLMMQAKKEQGRLPKEYQEVEYLKSTGTQYMNLGFMPQRDLRYELEFRCKMTSSIPSTPYHIAGVNQIYGGSTNRFYPLWATGTSWGIGYGDNITIDEAPPTGFNNYKVILAPGGQSITLNGILVKNATATLKQNVNVAVTLFAFCNPEKRATAWTISSFSVSINGTPFLDLIPCYRKSDNKPGMLDMVSLTFFTNSGSGEFILGPEIH